ncbi:MAG TPA: hypothetical protein VNC16_06880 [Solirubrobacterales bacterium]|jgi:hypothetical protein|nr:hypothetical protein [Solirubrobacterales bacterium]
MKTKLSVGDTLGEVFSIYRDQAGVLLPVAFWLFLGVAILEALTEEVVVGFLLAIVLSLVVATLYQGMVVGLVQDVQDGRRDSSVSDLMRSVAPVVLPLLGAGLIIGVGAGIGFLLLVVPGLYLITIWAVTAPVIVVERRGVFDALGRSRQLVRGSGWPVLGVLVLTFLITAVVGAALALLANAIADSEILAIVLSVLGTTVTAPIAALVASVLYFRLLEIREREEPASVPEQGGDGLG